MRSPGGGRTLFYVILVVALAASTTLMFWAGRGPSPDAVPTSSEVAARTMSPFCPGLTIEECPSAPSADLRSRIDEKVSQGYTNAEIDKWLVDNYGEAVLATPKSPWAGVVPKAALPAGVLLLAMTVRRWARVKGPSPAASEEPGSEDADGHDDDPARSEMQEEFARFRAESQG